MKADEILFRIQGLILKLADWFNDFVHYYKLFEFGAIMEDDLMLGACILPLIVHATDFIPIENAPYITPQMLQFATDIKSRDFVKLFEKYNVKLNSDNN